MFSLGIIFFEMCHPPWGTEMERYEVLSNIRKVLFHHLLCNILHVASFYVQEKIIFPPTFDVTHKSAEVSSYRCVLNICACIYVFIFVLCLNEDLLSHVHAS